MSLTTSGLVLNVTQSRFADVLMILRYCFGLFSNKIRPKHSLKFVLM